MKSKKLNNLNNLCKGQKGGNFLSTSASSHDNAAQAEQIAENGEHMFTMEGRMIIDVNFFANQMICKACGHRLHLLDIVEERRLGPASLFIVICPEIDCLHRNSVTTSKKRDDTKGPFAVNCKSVLGKFLHYTIYVHECF